MPAGAIGSGESRTSALMGAIEAAPVPPVVLPMGGRTPRPCMDLTLAVASPGGVRLRVFPPEDAATAAALAARVGAVSFVLPTGYLVVAGGPLPDRGRPGCS